MSKIVGIGMHKTGTTTLGAALDTLGFRVCGWSPELSEAFLSHNHDFIWNLVESHDAFQDHPWPFFYKEIDKRYPNSKFILTLRNEQEWTRSVANFFGNRSTELRKWVYGVDSVRKKKEILLTRFRQHNNEVREYFRTRENDLLEVSLDEGDGWKKICEFLNTEIPNVPFPYENRGAYKLTDKAIRYFKYRKTKILERFLK